MQTGSSVGGGGAGGVAALQQQVQTLCQDREVAIATGEKMAQKLREFEEENTRLNDSRSLASRAAIAASSRAAAMCFSRDSKSVDICVSFISALRAACERSSLLCPSSAVLTRSCSWR